MTRGCGIEEDVENLAFSGGRAGILRNGQAQVRS